MIVAQVIWIDWKKCMMNTSKGLAHPACDAQHFQGRQILWEIGLGPSCGSSLWRLVPPTWQKQPSHSRWSLAHHHSIIVQVQAHVVIVRPTRVLHQWFQLHVHTGDAPLSEPRLDVGEAFEGFTGQWTVDGLCTVFMLNITSVFVRRYSVNILKKRMLQKMCNCIQFIRKHGNMYMHMHVCTAKKCL